MAKIFNFKRINVYNPTGYFKGLHCIDTGCCEYEPGDKVEKISRIGKSYYTLLVVADGGGVVTVNGNVINIKKGNVLFVPPCQEYTNITGRENVYRYFWLSFEGEDVENYLKSKKFYKEDEPLSVPGIDKVYSTFTKFLIENTQEKVTEERFNRLFFDLMEYINSPINDKNKDEDYINKIISLISENYENASFNVRSISESMHLSHSWLCALFKKKTGVTMQQYLINVRLGKAKELLVQTDMPVNAIAFLCGFNDALYFSTSFRKTIGISPTCYRLSSKNAVNEQK